MEHNTSANQLFEVASRIREMREIAGYTEEQMAVRTEVSVDEYRQYERGELDFPFTFIHKCSLALGVGMTDLLEGQSANLSGYEVMRSGRAGSTAHEDGIDIRNLAPRFRDKIAQPHWVCYAYSEEQQNLPIHTTTHSGQEFDYVLRGRLKVRVGNHTEVLDAGDSIYYDSSTPHGMIAIDGEDCVFLAVVLPGDKTEDESFAAQSVATARQSEHLLIEKFIHTEEDENGSLKSISFENEEQFNFAFDVVDEIAKRDPDKLAMIHLDKHQNERRFTYDQVRRISNQCANYFLSMGINKGDRVMLVLKRHYQFWFSILALHKIGAIAIPATHLLVEHDFVYRFQKAGVKAILCTADDDTAHQVDLAAEQCPTLKLRILAGGQREGWRDMDTEYPRFSSHFSRTSDTPCGSDPMVMFFTSGTTGYPKLAAHNYKYALGHFITARYWHDVHPDGLHLTVADTGWGKALWGKLYGQWMCEGAVFVYDFDRFNAAELLPMFAKYRITTFCAPPTIYRMLIKDDLSKYDLTSLRHITTAGEALNPEVYQQFKKATGLRVMEGFGQTETTLSVANLVGMTPKSGSMGRPVPQFDVDIVDENGNSVDVGQNGEIVIRTDKGDPCGLFLGYYNGEEDTAAVWHDGMYHTGDVAWRDEDGYYYYVSRIDDVIKSSGYRIGPAEIENVLMELPYVLECGVSAAPDEVRGQIVKASIVLTPGTEGTEELKKEIQNYVKHRTAPYKYPRMVVFRDELPKTISGKIIRSRL